MSHICRSIFLVGLYCITLAALSLAAAGQQNSSERPAPAVVVEPASEAAAEQPTVFIGHVEALEAVDLRSRVPGFIEEIAFNPGALVKAGDVLFVVEPARYESLVAAARAQVARAEAVLRQATITRDRNAELVRRNTTARAALDDAQAAYDIANADLAEARASLAKAELDLSYTRIVAPISGRIGQPALTRGNLVASDATALARIVQVDPIRVTFSITESDLTSFRQAALAGNAPTGDAFRVNLRFPNGTTYDHEGRLEFLGPEIDSRTGTVAVRTIFPNPDGILMPGQFVNFVIGSRDTAKGLVVSQSAVLQDRDGRFVYVMAGDHTVHARRIETGAKIADHWAVKQGLEPGEMIVVQGTQRLSDGIAVRPVPADSGTR